MTEEFLNVLMDFLESSSVPIVGVSGVWLRHARHGIVAVTEDFDAHTIVFLEEGRKVT